MTEPEPTNDALVPIDYSRYRKGELQDMCRQRGLPTGGTLPDLIDRLGRHDQQTGKVPMVPAPPLPDAPSPQESGPALDTAPLPQGLEPDLSFLVSGDPGQVAMPAPVSRTEVPPATVRVVGPAEQAAGLDKRVSVPTVRGELVQPGVFRTSYPCPTELTTETHQRFLQRVVDDATRGGLQVRGGPYRSGWLGDGDERRAVYDVSVRKE